jgi:hypothetical protein
MKTSTIIRFVVAALFATLACVGLLLGITGFAILWVVPWLLLMGRSELTKPIPRKEWSWTFLLIGVLLVVFLTLPFLHLPPAPNQTVRFAIAVPTWFLWMWAIYRRWQREKGKADA